MQVVCFHYQNAREVNMSLVVRIQRLEPMWSQAFTSTHSQRTAYMIIRLVIMPLKIDDVHFFEQLSPYFSFSMLSNLKPTAMIFTEHSSSRIYEYVFIWWLFAGCNTLLSRNMVINDSSDRSKFAPLSFLYAYHLQQQLSNNGGNLKPRYLFGVRTIWIDQYLQPHATVLHSPLFYAFNLLVVGFIRLTLWLPSISECLFTTSFASTLFHSWKT